ncbi:hypothetical protein PsAD26_01614 [Pseudovibrio sp. Ad26]|nr:hypothetical protein PsAD26_01614 [Pseudovibrio sp. Ad26]KZL28046.1 hypothetical protein PsWM33_00557 [Pseudovibrio sp. WM33]
MTTEASVIYESTIKGERTSNHEGRTLPALRLYRKISRLFGRMRAHERAIAAYSQRIFGVSGAFDLCNLRAA